MAKLPSVYDSVTNRIIESLEAGTVPWVKPWTARMPYNVVSQQEYRGVNVLLLWEAAFLRGYTNPAWLTFRQTKELGGNVRKGETATHIVYASTYTKREVDDQGQENECEAFFFKWYCVFNIEQTERLPQRLYHTPEPGPLDHCLEHVQEFIIAIGAEVAHGYDEAAYFPSQDIIALPNPEDFESPEHYYATSLHEHGHWTGASTRLNRDLSERFGSKAYAAEELVAELTSAFLCAHLEIPGQLRHADYIGSWLELLRGDKKAIFTAAAKAAGAADYLRILSGEVW